MAIKRPNSLTEDIGRALGTKNTRTYTQAYTGITRRMNELTEELGDLYERIDAHGGQVPSEAEPEYRKDVKRVHYLESQIDRLGTRQTIMGNSAAHRGMQQAENIVRRSFDPSTINGAVHNIGKSASAQASGMALGSSLSWEDIQSRKGSIANQLTGIEGSMQQSLQIDPSDPRGTQLRAHLEKQKNFQQSKLAELGVAEKTAAALGKDPSSKYAGYTDAYANAKPMEDASTAAKKVVEAFEALNKAINEGTKDIKGLEAALEAAIKGSGGGEDTRQARLGKGIVGFQAAAGTMMELTVNQRIAQRSNTAELANIENDKYQMYKAARGGDVKSQMLLSQWGTAEKFGGQVGLGGHLAVRARQMAGYLQTAQGALQAANPVNDAVDSGQNAFNNTTSGIANSTIADADANRRVTETQVRNAAVRAHMAAAGAVIATHAEQVQGFRNYATGMGVAARGMGSEGGAFLANTVSSGTLSRMSAMGISPEQMTQMAQMGQANMGSMFDKTGEQVFAARGLEKSGHGTMQENMQRMSTLAGSGANNPQAGLSGVLEAAFGKSLENAKTLNMLVENTGAMAGRSVGARAGLDTTGEVATMLVAGMDPNQKNREQALSRSVTAAERANQIVTSEDVSFVNMAGLARIGKTTGMSGVSGIMAGKLDVGTLRHIAKMSPQDQAAALRQQGVNADESNNPDLVGTLIKDAQMKVLDQGAVAIGEKYRANILERFKTGNTKWDRTTAEGRAEEATAGQYAKAAGFTGSADDFIRSGGAFTAKNDPNAVASVDGAMKGSGGSEALKQVDELLTGGFKQLSDAASSAAEQLGGVTEAMKTLVELQQSADAEGGTKGEGEFSGAAAASAATFGAGAKTFADAADKWNSIAQKLIDSDIFSKRGSMWPDLLLNSPTPADTKKSIPAAGR